MASQTPPASNPTLIAMFLSLIRIANFLRFASFLVQAWDFIPVSAFHGWLSALFVVFF